MRIFVKVLFGVVLASILFTASCCCSGGLDDDDLPLNLPHNEGTGGDA